MLCMKNTLIYQIDRVLYFFSLTELHLGDGTKINAVAPFSKFEARKMITQTFQELDNDISFQTNYSAIIDKLEKDGHLKIIPEKIHTTKLPNGDSGIAVRTQKEECKITFEGLLWLERGGYYGELKRNGETEMRNRNSYNLNWIIGVSAVVVGLDTMFQAFDYYEKHSLDIQNAAYFFSGIGLSILLLITRQIILRMLNKN